MAAGLHALQDSSKSISFPADNITLLDDGKDQKLIYHVQNCSPVSRKLRVAISKGSSKSFAVTREEKVLASGLKLPVTLEYTPRGTNTGQNGTLEIYMDDILTLTIPIKSILPCCVISCEPSTIEFKTVPHHHQTVTKCVAIRNTGTKEGHVAIDGSRLPSFISISATNGVLKPNDTLLVQVRLLCREVCVFDDVINILVDGVSVHAVPVRGSVVSTRLQLLDNGDPLNTLHIGLTYYGSVVKRSFTVHNDSPSNTNFIAMLSTQANGYEQGVNMNGELSLACTEGGLEYGSWKEQGTAPLPSKMITVTPSEGVLKAHESLSMEVLFKPSFVVSEKGWKHHQELKSRRDYALFVAFNTIGENMDRKHLTEQGTELGVTASVIPVNISTNPSKSMAFGECVTGLVQSKKLTISNHCDLLSATYVMRLPAHFKVANSKGILKPGESSTMDVIFQPKQFGRLGGRLSIDIYQDESSDVVVYTHSISIHGIGASNNISKKNSQKQTIMATPDDLSCSVRPHDKRCEVITPFTRVQRHTYIDPDYALTDQETNAKQDHNSYYTNYIKQQKTKRIKAMNERRLGKKLPDSDSGIQPAAGITPPTLSLEASNGLDIGCHDNSDTILTDADHSMKHTIELTRIESPLVKHCSAKMVDQCEATLTPTQLSMITIDPPLIERIGDNSIVRGNKLIQEVQIKNYLLTSLMCVIKVDSPMSIVRPHNKKASEWRFILSPQSYTPVTVEFLSQSCGQYHQSIECVFNKGHSFQVPVIVSVVDISVIPSSTHVVLSQYPLSTHNTQLQGTVTLYNPHMGVPALYSWDLLDHVDYLIVSTSEGVIPPLSSISCHFMYSNESSQWIKDDIVVRVNIECGNPIEITLKPKYLKSDCHFKETVLFFNPASLYLPCKKTITCVNKSVNHGYYKVLGCYPPVQGVVVSPMSGCVPAGGQTELSFELTATELGSFESWFKVQLREGKTISIRITGSVELPRVYIDKDQFVFGNVYCGSTASLPFTLYNKGLCQVFLTFNFTSFSAFKVTLPDNTDPYRGEGDMCTSCTKDGIYQVVMASNSSINCVLHFTPTDIASYDFITPILINGQDPVAPPASRWPPSMNDPQISINRSLPSLSDTPKRRVVATTVLAPLRVTNTASATPNLTKHCIELVNVSDGPVSWYIRDHEDKHVREGNVKFFLPSNDELFDPSTCQKQLLPNETFTFNATFTPSHHGQYTANLPLYIDGGHTSPYRELSLTAVYIPERILSYPSHIAVQPVPLGVTVEAQFTVELRGFSGSIVLEASIPDAYPDGVQVSVSLPEKFERSNNKEEGAELTCELLFCSAIPISISDSITFQEKSSGKVKKVPFTVCSDNSLLTVYEFISDNINSAKFHCDSNGVPVLHLPYQPCVCRSKSSLSSASSSFMGSVTPQSISNSSVTYGDLFLTDCKGYLCRYMSLFGSSNGLRNIRNPTEFIQCVGKEYSNDGRVCVRNIGTSRGPLLDLIRHLCGRLPPGIPQTPVPCKTRMDRIERHLKEITATLDYLRSLGALLWVVVPESLLDWRDFVCWRDKSKSQKVTSLLTNANKDEFQETSERAWTHLLAQIMKVIVVPRLLSNASLTVDCNTSGSNVYSHHEIQLLAWMNRLHRDKTPSRQQEVFSFDVDLMDCNVLSSVIRTYAPYIADDYFSDLYEDTTTPEQVQHNALLLVKTCRELKLNYDIQSSDLSAPHPIGLLLFASYLFHCLPSYLPQTTVTLKQELGNKAIQKVQVSNPSVNTLQYTSMIVGKDKDCFSTSDSIHVPPHSSVYVEIVFNVKRITSCSAVLILLSATGKGRPGQTIVFCLNGEPTLVKPISVNSVESCLYKTLSVPVKVTNIFEDSSEFKVSLTEGLKLQEVTRKKKVFKDGSVSIATKTLHSRSTDGMTLFHTRNSSVSLDKNESATITLEFIPMRIQPRQCCVVLSSRHTGDMIFLVNVTVNNPHPTLPVINNPVPSAHVNNSTRTLHLKSTVGETVIGELVVSNRNQSFEDAVIDLGKWMINPTERQRRMETNSLWYSSLRKAIALLSLNKGHENKGHEEDESPCVLHFSVSPDNDMFDVPQSLDVPATRNSSSVLPIEFKGHSEGRYSCNILLTSTHDIRVYCVEVMVMDKGRTADIEIVTPAWESITQNLPLTNPTTMDWPLHCELNGSGFSGPSELLVKALSTGYYPLTFAPRRESTCQGSLRLVNTNDETEHCFTLKGIGEKPQAQAIISVRTKAKASVVHTLHVPNTNDRTTTYTIECDLDYVSGPPSLTVAGGDVVEYPILIEPLERGQYSGAVVFIAEDKSTTNIKSTTEHLWYQLTVFVDPSDPIDTQTINGHALSETQHTIVVTNPFDTPVTLKASMDGAGLSGPCELYVNSCDHALYTVVYCPNEVGVSKGFILFTGREDGEISFELELLSNDPLPVALGTAQCELGKSVYGSLSLNNPLDHDVTLTYVTENDHFNVVGLINGEITVPANTTSDVSVMFKPSAIGPEHSATLTFISDKFGRQDFTMDGIGIAPSPGDPTVISCLINSNSMAIVTFTNPLSHSASFDIKLTTDHDIFCLFLKQSKGVCLQSGVSIDVPIMYAPDSMNMMYTEVIINTNEGADLSWVYPVHGQPENLPMAPPTRSAHTTIKGRAKERVETCMEVCMNAPVNDEELSLREKYRYEVVPLQDDHYTLVKEYTGIQLLKGDCNTNGEVQLSFNIVFLPSKPIKFRGELHVQPLGYGIWRYPLSFEADDPLPDDTIILQAKHLTKVTKKSFYLTSLTDELIPFKASLFPSSNELTVSPLSGDLQPKHTEGTKFTVSYKPKSFNKSTTHILKVETEQCQWCYEIIGEPSAYHSPSKHSIAKVDHRGLSQVNMAKKNFLRHNIEVLHD